MTDTSNNNLSDHLDDNLDKSSAHPDHPPTSHGHIQDKLVKDSITHSQDISAKAQARQSPVPQAMTQAMTKTTVMLTLLRSKTYQQEHHKVNKQLCQIVVLIKAPTPIRATLRHKLQNKRPLISVTILIIRIRLILMAQKRLTLVIKPLISQKNKLA